MSKMPMSSLALLLAACGGSGGGGGDDDPGGTPQPGVRAEFQSIQDEVFTPICVECHVGAFATGNLRLEEAVSYNMLVNRPSEQVPSLLRVEPGDPDNSYIVQKLEGRAAVGGRMPLGRPPLSNATIAAIRQWIAEGAQPPPAARAATGPARMRTSFPADGADVAQAQVLRLAFDRELDATRLLADTAELRGADGELWPVRVRFADADYSTVLVEPLAPLTAGAYRLQLHGLADLAGRPVGAEAATLDFAIREAP